MLCPEIFAAFPQRFYDIVVEEPLCKEFVTLVRGYGIQVPESFRHSSELVTKHKPAGVFIQSAEFVVCPVRHRTGYGECILVADIQILVYQSCEYLVQGVPRGPHPLSFQVPVYKAFGECAKIAVAICLLHGLQSCDKAVPFHLEAFASCRSVHQS